MGELKTKVTDADVDGKVLRQLIDISFCDMKKQNS